MQERENWGQVRWLFVRPAASFLATNRRDETQVWERIQLNPLDIHLDQGKRLWYNPLIEPWSCCSLSLSLQNGGWNIMEVLQKSTSSAKCHNIPSFDPSITSFTGSSKRMESIRCIIRQSLGISKPVTKDVSKALEIWQGYWATTTSASAFFRLTFAIGLSSWTTLTLPQKPWVLISKSP